VDVQKINLHDLKPLEVNVRKHGENQLKELMRSVQQFGQTRAIVVDEDNNILIGNGLHAAMVKAGLTDCFIYRKTGLSETEKKKLILADNKTYSLGTDDYENIEAYIADITASGDFDIAGFDEEVLRNLMRDADEVLADVQNYGVLTAEVVEKKQGAAERVETPAAQQNAPESHPERIPAPEPEQVPTVMCPNCGECIALD
jgi:ParB-like chromosome segregation protein Spo0J